MIDCSVRVLRFSISFFPCNKILLLGVLFCITQWHLGSNTQTIRLSTSILNFIATYPIRYAFLSFQLCMFGTQGRVSPPAKHLSISNVSQKFFVNRMDLMVLHQVRSSCSKVAKRTDLTVF